MVFVKTYNIMATLKVADINKMAGRFTKLMPRPGRLVSVRASDLLTRQARHHSLPLSLNLYIYPCCISVQKALSSLLRLYLFTLLIRVMIIVFIFFPKSKFKFSDTQYNEGFWMADKHGGGECCFSAP